METRITRRPIISAVPASGAMLSEILARIAGVRGRASDWGVVDDSTLAEHLARESVEADFTRSYYRDGFVEASDPALLPGWTFTRTGVGTARDAAGQVISYASGVPRINDRGLLVEGASTNLMAGSEDLGTYVSVSQATLTEDTVLRPNGLMTGATWTRTGPDGNASFFGITAVGRVSASIDLKPGTGTEVSFQITDLSTGYLVCLVDLATRTVESSSASGTFSEVFVRLTPLADGWTRLDLSGLKAVGADPVSYAVLTPVLGTDVLYLAAPQINQGRPTSYIPTNGATATRGAETATVSAPIFASGGTLFVEFENPIVAPATRTAMGTSSGGQLYAYDGAALVYQSPTNLAAAPGEVLAAGGISRLAVCWAPGSRRACLNGGDVVADAVPMATAATISLGSLMGAEQLQAPIRRFIVFGAVLTDAQLQAITS